MAALVIVGVAVSGVNSFLRPGESQAAYFTTTTVGYNGSVIFESNRDGNYSIYSVHPDGTELTRLTSTAASDRLPSVSPDGSKIVFVSNRDGDQEIYLMNVDGSDQVNLTNDPLRADDVPSWSPDGTKILFQSKVTPSGANDIHVMDVDGGNKINLTNYSGAHDTYASWSPDGATIAFSRSLDIYSIRPDGSDLTQLTVASGYDDLFSWSPDSSQILFRSRRDGDQAVYVMDRDGSNQARLAAGFQSAWSPDGSRVAVSSNHQGNYDIYVMNADGSNLVNLTQSPADERLGRWSPDGQEIAFHSNRDSPVTTDDAIFIADVDGDNLVRLDDIYATSYVRDWQSHPNTAPATIDDTLTLMSGDTAEVDVLANDIDEEPFDPQYLTIATQPDHGTATVLHGKIRYTPRDGFHGSDALTYQICDSFLLDQQCATGVLAITVAAPNTPTATLTNVGSLSVDSSTNSYQTAERRPTFSGTADPFAEIRIEIHSDPIVLTATADGDGNWSVTPDQDLPLGEHTVSITATNAGVTTVLESFVLAVVTADARLDELPATGATAGAVRTIGSLTLALGVGCMVYRRWRTVA